MKRYLVDTVDLYEEGNPPLREHADALAEAVDRWWSGKCPLAYTEAEHRANPYVNLQGSHERGLADALAAYRALEAE
jgi:hypothetical protein